MLLFRAYSLVMFTESDLNLTAGTCPAVQRLRPRASAAGAVGLTPVQGIKIPHGASNKTKTNTHLTAQKGLLKIRLRFPLAIHRGITLKNMSRVLISLKESGSS